MLRLATAWLCLSQSVVRGDTHRLDQLEERVRRLELLIERQQKLIDAPNAAPSETNRCITRKKSVCIAVPCVPRHLPSLRLVLHDIRNQSLLPNEVVVSLSQSSEEDGRALEQELKREFFDGDVKGNGQQHWPRLRIVASAEARSHSENNNRAASFCESDIVSWFDADDRMHPRRTEMVELAFRRLGSAAVLHGHYTEVPLSEDRLPYFDAQSWDRTAAWSESSSSSSMLPPVLKPRPLADHRRSETSTLAWRSDENDEEEEGEEKDKNKKDEEEQEGAAPISVALGQELYDLYEAKRGSFGSYYTPPVLAPGSVQHGHVSVDRALVLGAWGLRWKDVPTGGQAFGEDVRFVGGVLARAGRRDDAAAVLAANLTLYQPSWGASKRCIVGPRILFDCRVTARGAGSDSSTMQQVEFSSYDAVLNCPTGTQPGYYVDESDWSKGVQCLRPDEREEKAPGLRYLDDFVAFETDTPQWQAKMYADHGFENK